MRRNIMRRIWVIGFALALAGSWPGLAWAKLVWVYQDGQPVAYPVSEDYEYYAIAAAEIHEANAALLGEVKGYDPQVADIGYGSTKYDDDDVHYSEWYTRRRGAVYLKDVAVQDYLSPGDWRGLFGEYFDPGAAYAELDKSGPHWSLDAQGFSAYGWVYGVDEEDLVYSDRRRQQARLAWRRGSMDGGVWRASVNGYRVSTGAGTAQPRDVKHYDTALGFRQAEANHLLESSVFYGANNSTRGQQDNAYAGGKLAGTAWLGDHVALSADAKYTSIDVQQQDATVQRADGGAGLAWELGRFATLSARARFHDEQTDLAANSHLTGYQDAGARLELHPSASVRLSAGYRERNLDFERLRLEDPAVLDFIFAEAVPTANELADLRSAESATSKLYEYEARFKLGRDVLAGAGYSQEQIDGLPETGQAITSTTAAPYFGDERSRGNAYIQYLLGQRTNLALRGGYERERNSLRESEYYTQHYGLHCTTALGPGVSFLCGASRRQADLDLARDPAAWDSDAWSYDAGFTGAGGCLENYRLSYRWQQASGTAGGDFQGLGLELRLRQYPVCIAGWWRDRETNLHDGQGTFDDAGINITYRIDFRKLDLSGF
jgi:hypothetical protein